MSSPAPTGQPSMVTPAFPVGPDSQYLHSEWNGLSKREYVAVALLSGLLSRGGSLPKNFKSMSAWAIHYADELLAQIQELAP